MRSLKDWDAILEELSSGEESDEYDVPNIVSIKKHAPKLMEMVANIVEENAVDSKNVKAHKKATTNTSSEPVMQSFKTVKNKINEVVSNKIENTKK